MATTGYEISPREVTNNGAKRVYRVEEALTEDDLIAWMATSIPATVAGFPFSDFDAQEVEGDVPGNYDVRINWGTEQNSDTPLGESTYRFNYQAPAGHIYQSLATMAVYTDATILPGGLTVDTFGGAINVVWDEGKDRVEGQQIDAPPEVFTIAYNDVDAIINSAYQATVRGLCGKVNSVAFYGANIGEIMLVRAQGDRQRGLWNLEFGFSYIPNTTGEAYGDITGVAKDGHDLLWVYYLPAKDATAKELVKRPAAVIIDRVFRRGDLNALNLPS